MGEARENARLYTPFYFDVITSGLYRKIPGDPLKLYWLLRRFVCRARSGHSLSLFYVQGYLAASGYLGTYAKLFGKSESTVSRWLKTLEDHKIISTYRKGREGTPSIWILGRVIHVEGSEYGVDVFFLDHLAEAQEKDQHTVETFDDTQMKECESPEHIKLNSTLALLQVQMQARMQGSNRKEVIEKKERLSDAKTPEVSSPADPSEDYTITYYYRDREYVTIVGKAATGPWRVMCPGCDSAIQVNTLEEPVDCNICGLHEIVVTRTKPRAQANRYPEPVETYYAIVRARGVKYGSMVEWHPEIVSTVDDVDRWRQVVKEYISQTGKNGKPWSALSVDRMLEYYRDNRLPGTRKKGKKKPHDAEEAQYGHLEQTPLVGQRFEEVEVRDDDGRLLKVVQRAVKSEV